MSYLRGNYPLKEIVAEASSPCSPFEKAALARLGGSICFVAKAPMVWPARVAE